MREGHGARDRDVGAGERHALRLGGREQALGDRRHEGQERRGMPLGDGEDEVGIELGEQHQARAHRHGERQAERQTVRVEHRQDRVDDAALPAHDRRHPGSRLCRIREQIGVREHRALRRAGGAAGVLNDRQIAGGGARVRRGKRVVAEELRPGRGIRRLLSEGRAGFPRLRDGKAQRHAHAERHRLGDVDGDEGVHAQVGGEVLHGSHDLAPHDRVLRAVILELLAELARGIERVVLHDDRAQAQHRVEGDDVLRTVRQDDRHGIARPHAVSGEGRGDAAHLGRQVGVRRRAPEELQGGGVGVVTRGRVEDVDEGARLGSRSSGTPAA